MYGPMASRLLLARLLLGLALYLVWMSCAVSSALMGALDEQALPIAGALLMCLAILPGSRAAQMLPPPVDASGGSHSMSSEGLERGLKHLRVLLVAVALAVAFSVPNVVAPSP